MKPKVIDKAGKGYWESVWAKSNPRPQFIDPRKRGIRNYLNRRFHQYFMNIFGGMETQKMTLLEVGCARSIWLPYFAKEYGFKISGIDYSEVGCQQARQLLSTAGLSGEIICADLFSPPEIMIEAVDIVVSFGVVEHFEDTAGCVSAIANFLKPGGILITSIPNLTGWIGRVQQYLNQPLLDAHVAIDVSALAQAHKTAGMEIIRSDYFLSTNFGVVNLHGIRSGTVERLVKSAVLKALIALSMVVWVIEGFVGPLPAGKLMSPYIICMARKIN